MSKEKYQQALSNIGGIVLEPSNDGYHDPRTVCQFFVEDIVLLYELVDIYPEYLELKAKATPMKPKEVEQNIYRCISCEKIIIPIGERKIWHKHFTPCCSNCGQLQDWSEND